MHAIESRDECVVRRPACILRVPEVLGSNVAAEDTGLGGEGGSPPPTPRWVKAFGLVALALVLLFVIKHLLGGGFRGHMGH